MDYLKALQQACDQKSNVIGPRAIAKHEDQTYYSALAAKPKILRWTYQQTSFNSDAESKSMKGQFNGTTK